MKRFASITACLVATGLLSGCAGLPSVLTPPEVRLTNVAVGEIGFSRQTFNLSFDVRNPNAFALPINHVSYSVKLNEQQFASGETVAALDVPANAASQFVISVDLDLLRTAPQLLYTVRDGVTGSLSYELVGKLGIDLPLVDRVSFRSSGDIRLSANSIHGSNLKQ